MSVTFKPYDAAYAARPDPPPASRRSVPSATPAAPTGAPAPCAAAEPRYSAPGGPSAGAPRAARPDRGSTIRPAGHGGSPRTPPPSTTPTGILGSGHP